MEIETSKDESSILTFSNEHHVKLRHLICFSASGGSFG